MAPADSPDSPVDSLKEKVVVSNKKHLNLIRNETQTAVTSMRLNQRRTKTGIFFPDLRFRMPQHTSSEVTVSLNFEIYFFIFWNTLPAVQIYHSFRLIHCDPRNRQVRNLTVVVSILNIELGIEKANKTFKAVKFTFNFKNVSATCFSRLPS